MAELTTIVGYEPKDCREVYGIINARQVTALMFHSEMADMFGFLGLEGFKCMHEYQFLEESSAHRATKSYYLSHHDKILSDDEVRGIDVVPDEWLRYTRMDVTPSIRRQSVEKAMTEYLKWEMDTKEVYSECAAYFLRWHKMSDFERVQRLIEDVAKEIKCLKEICLKLRASDYSLDYIVTLQDELCCKYKHKSVMIEG